MTEQLPEHWYPTALVLLIEHRTCTHCAASVAVPNTHLMVRFESCYPGPRRSRLARRDAVTCDIIDLDHETQDIFTTSERCASCFTSEASGQLTLFPRQPRLRPTWKALLAATKASSDEAKAPEKKSLAAIAFLSLINSL